MKRGWPYLKVSLQKKIPTTQQKEISDSPTTSLLFVIMAFSQAQKPLMKYIKNSKERTIVNQTESQLRCFV